MDQDKYTLEKVKEYYGKVLSSNKDLKTSACCTIDSMPKYLREIAKELHTEVSDRFYGCGTPIPEALEGCTVLDLGCGTGRDCYLLSKLVGPSGKVLGVDMTDEQLEIANRHVQYHMDKFGYKTPNVKFYKAYIEDLESTGIPSNSVDVVVSNCVVNLSPDKARVFAEVFRILKPGGEFYFSDVFSGRRVPKNIAIDPVVLGECLGGALYVQDFRRMMEKVGCPDYRILAKSKLTLDDPEIVMKAGMVDFYSITVRAFKVNLEDRCEDYGQVAYYKGTIPNHAHTFMLDDHHIFKTNVPMLVCGNTAAMVSETRYAKHFRVEGNRSVHYGLFDCGPMDAATTQDPNLSCC